MTEKEQRAIISRLHRILGQVAGIEKMVSEGASEEEIVIQINAVKQAAHRVGQMLLNSKVNDCIRSVAQSGDAEAGIEAYQKTLEFYSRM